MKRFILFMVLSLICVMCTIGLVACGDTEQIDTSDSRILSVYNTYVAYAEENGETPLSYEEWLASVKGADGNNGINGIDGKDGVSIIKIEKTSTDNLTDTYTITFSDDTTFLFTIKNGKDGNNGKDGENGQDGITPQVRINADTNEWEVSYDKGATWTSLGVKATGEKGGDGNNGNDGENGQDGIHLFQV